MQRHELSDEQWSVVQPLLPKRTATTGRTPSDPRMMLNGIFWILGTGAPWQDLPDRFGPWQIVYDHFRKWRKSGVFATAVYEDQPLLAPMQARDDDGGVPDRPYEIELDVRLFGWACRRANDTSRAVASPRQPLQELLRVAHRCGKADALQVPIGQARDALQHGEHVPAAVIAREGMQLIHDHRPRVGEPRLGFSQNQRWLVSPPQHHRRHVSLGLGCFLVSAFDVSMLRLDGFLVWARDGMAQHLPMSQLHLHLPRRFF